MTLENIKYLVGLLKGTILGLGWLIWAISQWIDKKFNNISDEVYSWIEIMTLMTKYTIKNVTRLVFLGFYDEHIQLENL